MAPKGEDTLLTLATTSWAKPDGGFLVEQVYDPETGIISFEVWKNGETETGLKEVPMKNCLLVPVDHKTVQQGIVLFPRRSEEYGTKSQLIEELVAFIRKYVVLKRDSDYYLLAYYVLYTYFFDKCDTAPSLRITGDLGMGKSRLLKILTLLAYRSIRASGSTSSPAIFRLLAMFHGGTLSLEEFDLRSKSEVDRDKMAILREGFERGNSVGRVQGSNSGKMDPVFFETFGPKIMSGRYPFPDAALNSRLLKIEMSAVSPIELEKARILLAPDARQMARDALRLRNKMLRYRQEHYWKQLGTRELPKVENRVAQALLPILQTVVDEESEGVFLEAAQRLSDDLVEARTYSMEGVVLKALGDRWAEKGLLGASKIHCKAIAESFEKDERWKTITPKKITETLRNLGFFPEKDKQGKYVVFEPNERKSLFERYGLECPIYLGDLASLAGPGRPSQIQGVFA